MPEGSCHRILTAAPPEVGGLACSSGVVRVDSGCQAVSVRRRHEPELATRTDRPGRRFAPDRAWCFSSSTPPSRTCDRPRVFDPGLCSFGARPDVRRLRRPRVDRLAPSLRRCSRLHARIGLIHLCRAMHPQRSLNGNLFLRQTMKREPWVELSGRVRGTERAAAFAAVRGTRLRCSLASFTRSDSSVDLYMAAVGARETVTWLIRPAAQLAGRGGGVESLVAGSGVVAARPLRRSSRASPSAAGL
jgi:hypothetical protein